MARRASADSEKLRYYTDAANIGEKVAGISPSFENFLVAGEAWLGAKSFSKALEWFKKAKQKRSRNSLVYFYSGQCHSSLSQFDAALSELQEALKIGATGKLRTQVYNQMGYVHAKKKDYDEARKAYAEAGNRTKEREMEENIKKEEQNLKAREEQREFARTLAALRLQIQELRKIGEDEEADRLQEQLDDLEKALNK